MRQPLTTAHREACTKEHLQVLPGPAYTPSWQRLHATKGSAARGAGPLAAHASKPAAAACWVVRQPQQRRGKPVGAPSPRATAIRVLVCLCRRLYCCACTSLTAVPAEMGHTLEGASSAGVGGRADVHGSCTSSSPLSVGSRATSGAQKPQGRAAWGPAHTSERMGGMHECLPGVGEPSRPWQGWCK